MSELTTVPSFVFYQGRLGDTDWERPINVQYYNGYILLEQQGDYPVPERITIHPEHLKALFKEILKHQPEAEYHLNGRSQPRTQ